MKDATINTSYFSEIDTYNKAYLLGFIAADGALVPNTNSSTITLTVTIHRKDISVLELLKEELNSSLAIRTINTKNSFSPEKQVDHVRFNTSQRQIIEDLMKLGLEPRKSLTMENLLPNIKKEFRKAFIIGYFDGDGCFVDSKILRKRKYIKKDGSVSIWKNWKYNSGIYIKGTEAFLNGIAEELNLQSFRNHKIKGQNINTLVVIKNSDILRFYNCYNYCDFYLNRKKDKFTRKIAQVQTISSSSK